MAGFWTNLFSTKPTTKPMAQPRQLEFETLEQRAVPAVTIFKGDIIITQTNGDDTCTVKSYKNDGKTMYLVTDNGQRLRFDARARNLHGGIIYNGLYGNDRFTNYTAKAVTADGGYGNDVIVGGTGHDNLKGGFGNDRLTGGLGNDTLDGGADADVCYGNEGIDTLFGGQGTDLLDGGEGNDTLWGGSETDLLYGDFGHDKLFGEGGHDYLEGGGDNDYLDGGADGIGDRMKGGLGTDTFKGEWVQSHPFALIYTNLDAPLDFNSIEGDKVTGQPWVFAQGSVLA